MLHKTKLTFWGVVAIALLCAPAVSAADWGWGEDGASANANLSNIADIRQPALALGANQRVAVAWASGQPASTKGIFIKYGINTPTESLSILTGNQDTWAPALAYNDDQLLAVWVQGKFPYPGTIIERDLSTSLSKTVFTPTYGYTAPRLLVGTDRLHMFFASAQSGNDFSKADLYYTYRRFADAQWIAPTLIITHGQAIGQSHGGIWYPHAALSQDKGTVHLVWEQKGTLGEGDIYRVFYSRGVWNATTERFDWAPLTLLSPFDKNGVRPKVTVDGADRVHVTWVEQEYQVIGNNVIILQYINYRRLENEQWEPPLTQPNGIRLDPDPVQVNTYRPTWSTISMDAQGAMLCVAWHGFRPQPETPGYEEILMRCSKNGGKTWDTHITNASETPLHLSLFPVLKLTAAGKLHLAWEEYTGPDFAYNYDVFYRQGPIPREKVYLPLTLRG